MERRGIERDVDPRADYWQPADGARTIAAMGNREYSDLRPMSWADAEFIIGLEDDAVREIAAGTPEGDLDPTSSASCWDWTWASLAPPRPWRRPAVTRSLAATAARVIMKTSRSSCFGRVGRASRWCLLRPRTPTVA
jgi:hypothetical protein